MLASTMQDQGKPGRASLRKDPKYTLTMDKKNRKISMSKPKGPRRNGGVTSTSLVQRSQQ